ncbi:hypothetical protein QBC41DRAFT_377770 [Cercophora samala]|uniref:Uncharacterized protein n=1 Tax=Cercophora samala TaxID=330535 RepID=A0AA40CTB4_9PEZI|nr:hypothetical protein QBC41DRAFT_377770 [Cercophora samala]
MSATMGDHTDTLINFAVTTFTTADQARDGQHRALRHLYEKNDTILIAPTAYGKRTVLYAFHLMTQKIIIQIIPSLKVAKEEARAISNKIYGSRPIVVTQDLLAVSASVLTLGIYRRLTVKCLQTTDFFHRMRANKYTHILVAPEDITSFKFMAELTRDPDFQNKIGLFVVHELHMANKWKAYYHHNVILDGLRYALPAVPWFASTACFDKESQEIVPQIVGFDLESTKYIRIPTDRPDISETLLRLEAEDNFAPLSFVLGKSKPAKITDIPKTVVYIANALQLYKIRRSLWRCAEHLGFSKSQARRVIQMYDDLDLDAEKDAVIQNLAYGAECRIVVSTSSLSVRNVPDVIRVVHWGFPMDFAEISLGEWWLRNGVVMRDINTTKTQGYESGEAYTFATRAQFAEMDRLMDKYRGQDKSNANETPIGTRFATPSLDDFLKPGGSPDLEGSGHDSAVSTLNDGSPRSTSTAMSSLADGHDDQENEHGPASEMDDLPVELTPDEFDDFGSTFYMDLSLQYAIARAYSRVMNSGEDVPFSDELSLFQRVPAILDWEFSRGTVHIDGLIEFCRQTAVKVYEDWQSQKPLEVTFPMSSV